VVAAALMDGTVGPRQYDEVHLNSPLLRQLLAKVRVEESAEFTKAYDARPVVHRTRVTVAMDDGGAISGESGGSFGDISDPISDRQITEKFAAVVSPVLGIETSEHIAKHVLALEALDGIASLTALLDGVETASDQS
jgi:2-methylcitrate dehydratase PrpD